MTTTTFDAPPPAALPPRRSLAPLLLTILALVVVAAIAFAGGLFVGLPPSNTYVTSVYLKTDVTTAQKDAVRTALTKLHPDGGVQFTDKATALKEFHQQFDSIDPTTARGMTADKMPESFKATTKGRTFDCTAVSPVKTLDGVDQVLVVQRPNGHRPGATIGC
jgi:hypothetical protein